MDSGALRTLVDGPMAPLLSCISYSLCSISMVLANKMIVSAESFNHPFSLCLLQNTVSFFVVLLARAGGTVDADPIKLPVAKLWLPVTVIFTGMLLTSFLSLGLLSVPMVTLFKNVTNVLIVAGDVLMFGQTATLGTLGALALMLVGALLSAWYDLMFSALGYFWMTCNCVATAGYVLYLRKAVDTVKLSRFGMVLYNTGLSLPFLLSIAVLTGEAGVAMTHPAVETARFWTLIAFTGSIGFFLSLSSMWCVQVTSPTTYSIVGSLNKVPLTVAGIFLFNVPVTTQSLIFIATGLAGGVVYSYTKALETERKRQEHAATESTKELLQAERRHPAPDGTSTSNGVAMTADARHRSERERGV